MYIEADTIDRAPVAFVYEGSLDRAARRGSILFYHGLGVSKEAHLEEMGRLAGAGFLAIGVDNVGHGQRRYPDYERRFAPERASRSFWEAVDASAREAPRIIDRLAGQGLCRVDRLGVSGISMGGCIAYGAVVADQRLRAAAPVIASPRYKGLKESPHLLLERFFPCALLSQTAADDDVVPPHPARELHEQLGPFYRQQPERLRYLEHAKAGHMMPPERWEVAMQELVGWFVRFLPP
jgi:dienelactone hydrolase